MSGWIPLHMHSTFSMLDGVSQPKQIAQRCAELGYAACSLTDHGLISGALQFLVAMKNKGIKPILGCELYLCEQDPKIKTKENRILSHLPILAKNLQGWKSLIKIVSLSHHKDHFYYKPRIDLNTLADMAEGNFIAFSGHPGSDLANIIFIDPKIAYAQTDYDEVKQHHIHADWKKRLQTTANRYIEIFGKENFFLEIQILDPEDNPAALIAARALRCLSQEMGIKRIATGDSHYPRREDAIDQHILLCTLLKTTLKQMDRKLAKGDLAAVPFRNNFKFDSYHIPSIEEMKIQHDEEELVNTVLIADMCESYDIRQAPILPTFPCPNDINPDDYLKHLCREGWRKKIQSRIDTVRISEYSERIIKELNVIQEAKLSSYFLIVQDYCNWARNQRMIVGPGRGSSAGCLISYLIGITTLDPIEYNLSFERFYNSGRNTSTHISLPDIDCDFPVHHRKEVVAYLKSKYGEDKVANIATFNSLKGKSAITEVLRAHDIPFDLVKRITINIPQENRISEELQVMKDRGEEPSIIRYALENDPKSFSEWCVLQDNDTYQGEFGPYFAQAIRLEKTKRNISTHPAGVILGITPLAETCPLIYDENIDGYIAGMEYVDLVEMGQVKLDILGVAALDRIQGVRNLLRYGTVETNG